MRDAAFLSSASLRPDEVRPNYLRKASLRANVNAKLSDKGSLAISTGYVSSRLRLPQNDNDVLGIISSGYTGGGTGSDTISDIPTWGFFPPHRSFQVLATQDIERFTGSAQGEWRPISWLSARATSGVDFTQRVDHDLRRHHATWWLWTCVVAIVLGLYGLRFVRRRSRG